MGFTSCRRFAGIFRFNSEVLKIIVNCEGIEIRSKETIELEEFFGRMEPKMNC